MLQGWENQQKLAVEGVLERQQMKMIWQFSSYKALESAAEKWRNEEFVQ